MEGTRPARRYRGADRALAGSMRRLKGLAAVPPRCVGLGDRCDIKTPVGTVRFTHVLQNAHVILTCAHKSSPYPDCSLW